MDDELDGAPPAPPGGGAPPGRSRPPLALVWSAGNLLLLGIVALMWLMPLPWESHPLAPPAPTATDIPLQLLTPTSGFALTPTPHSAPTSTPTPAHSGGGGGGAQPTATPIPPTPTSLPTATPIPPTPTLRPTPYPQS